MKDKFVITKKTEQAKNKWYENNIVITATLILCFPLGLLMMWCSAHSWKLWIKVAVTSIIVTVLTTFALIFSPDASQITVTPSVVYLEPGMIKLIDIHIFPENTNPSNIKYISSDRSVARAEKGEIIGVSEGYAEIHIEDIKSGVRSNTIKVTVLKSIVTELTELKAINTHDEAASAPMESIVYISKSGTKYHTADCSSLGDTRKEISLEKALASGKTPCKKCNPYGG